MKYIAWVLAVMLAACSPPEADPRAELDRIVATVDGSATASILNFRTEPTASPSHRATIEAHDGRRTARFLVFRKDGRWYYEGPVSLVTDGVPQDNYDISAEVSTIAHQFDLER